MKRSEMIKIISKYLGNKVMFRDDYELSLKHANNLLNIVEEEGMLPPLNQTKVDTTPSCFLSEFIDADNYYEWEEE